MAIKLKDIKRKHFPHTSGMYIDSSTEKVHLYDDDKVTGLRAQLLDIANDFIGSGDIEFDPEVGKYFLSPEMQVKLAPLSVGFEDVIIQQAANKCVSRGDAKTTSEVIRGVHLNIPLIASNMSTVTDAKFCNKLAELGSLGVLHRADTEEAIIEEVKKVTGKSEWVAASIGVGKGQYGFCTKLIKHGANIIFIDIAHGYAESVISLGRKIKKHFPQVKVVVGNTTNLSMLEEVCDFADALKVGIGSGLACTTKNTAGCHEKQFSAILKFKSAAKRLGVPIISDGGLREPADFTKALAAGANSVMAGSVFARCPESAGPISNGKKLYAGMASEWVQDNWRGGLKPGTCAEGKVVMLDLGPPVDKMLQTFQGALRSGITYAGATDVTSLQDLVKFIKV